MYSGIKRVYDARRRTLRLYVRVILRINVRSEHASPGSDGFARLTTFQFRPSLERLRHASNVVSSAINIGGYRIHISRDYA